MFVSTATPIQRLPPASPLALIGRFFEAQEPSRVDRKREICHERHQSLSRELTGAGLDGVTAVASTSTEAFHMFRENPGLLAAFIPTTIDSDVEVIAEVLQDELKKEPHARGLFHEISTGGNLGNFLLLNICSRVLSQHCGVSPLVDLPFTLLATSYFSEIGTPLVHSLPNSRYGGELLVRRPGWTGYWHTDGIDQKDTPRVEFVFPVSDFENTLVVIDPDLNAQINRETREVYLENRSGDPMLDATKFQATIELDPGSYYTAPRGFITAFRGGLDATAHRVPFKNQDRWRVGLSYTHYI